MVVSPFWTASLAEQTGQGTGLPQGDPSWTQYTNTINFSDTRTFDNFHFLFPQEPAANALLDHGEAAWQNK